MQQNEPTIKEKFLTSFSSFLSIRGKVLVLFAILLLLAIIGVAINSERRASITNRSTALIEELEEKYIFEFESLTENDEQKRAEMLEDILSSLDDIISKYRRYYAAQRALYLKGEIYFNEEQYTKAAESFSALASRYKKSYLAPISLNNAAVSCEELGDNDSAIKYYKTIIERHSSDYPYIPHTLFSLGRLHEAKEDFNVAAEYYNMITNQHEESDWSVFSRNRLIYLKGAGKI